MNIDFLKSRLPLLVLLLVFVVLKYPHLYSSFYWDESWPYASAVYKMYQNGASLLPGAIDGILSRGHPLLFHYFGALWMYVFGDSIFALHCYALSISLLVLVSVYEISFRLFGFRVAVLALLLVAFQEIFFVQAAFVLPEILVALLVLLSLYFYVAEKFVLTAISLSLLFLTKESGIVLGIVLGLDALIQLMRQVGERKKNWIRLGLMAIPFVVILSFFLLQKHISGWYVLPLYSEGIDNNWDSLFYKFAVCLDVVFCQDYRYLYYYILIALALILSIIKRSLRPLLPLGLATIIFILTNHRPKELLGAILLFVLFIGYFIGLVYDLNNRFLASNIPAKRFVMLGVVFSLCFFAFSATLFIIYRYLFAALIPMLLISAVFLNAYLSQISSKLFVLLVLCIIGVESFNFYNSKGIGDNVLGAFDAIKVHEEIATYLEQHQFYTAKIGTGGFLHTIHLTDSNTKYLKNGKIFEQVGWDMNDSSDLVIFDNIENDYRYEEWSKRKDFHLLYRSEYGKAWAEIYERKK